MNTIMNEEKKSELDTVTLKNDVLRKYFPLLLYSKANARYDYPAVGTMAEKETAGSVKVKENKYAQQK